MQPPEHNRLARTLARHLQSWQRSGVSSVPRAVEDAAVGHTPVSETVSESVAATVSTPVPTTVTPVLANVAVPMETPPDPVREPIVVNKPAKPLSPKQRVKQLDTLAACVADCRRCVELADTRTQTVFGVGDPNAKVMFIGEAPGADEDRTGEPFVGRAGQLLNKIIDACGWTREELYICNILKCRPPENRNPDSTEAANCREYLDAQIATVRPDYIVCWGTIAAKNLLDSKNPIGRMRKQFFSYADAKVLCTYHPSYLLRNPPAKKEVWDDMKFLMSDMGLDPDRATK